MRSFTYDIASSLRSHVRFEFGAFASNECGIERRFSRFPQESYVSEQKKGALVEPCEGFVTNSLPLAQQTVAQQTVGRVERSEIRERRFPHFASLNAGYGLP